MCKAVCKDRRSCGLLPLGYRWQALVAARLTQRQAEAPALDSSWRHRRAQDLCATRCVRHGDQPARPVSSTMRTAARLANTKLSLVW